MEDIYEIPGPDNEGPVKWVPIIRVGSTVPFGYTPDPNDEHMLLPVEKELELFEQAKVHLKRYSLRKVAAWLSEESGRYISHVGLQKRVKVERKRRKQADVNRRLIERLEKALEKARKYQEERESHTGKVSSDGSSTTSASAD